MNKTNELAIIVKAADTDKDDAIKYFSNLYKEIKYLPDSDSFKYRGEVFDYFKAGIGASGNAYMLVDKQDSSLWLFTFGELEDRWQDYLERKEEQKRDFMIRMLTILGFYQ